MEKRFRNKIIIIIIKVSIPRSAALEAAASPLVQPVVLVMQDSLKLFVCSAVFRFTSGGSQDKIVRHSLTKELIEDNYPEDAYVYLQTDGSAAPTESMRATGAAFAPETDIVRCQSSQHCNKYNAEMQALQGSSL